MKTFFLATSIILILLLSSRAITGQSNQIKLNQLELMKQFLGSWQTEMAKDTFQIDEYTSFGTAIEGNIKTVTNGKVLNSIKQLWGYDAKNDKIILIELWESSPEITQYALWFTSENTCEGVPYQDISNPQNAAMKFKVVVKSSDKWVMSMLQNNIEVAAMTFTRIKNN